MYEIYLVCGLSRLKLDEAAARERANVLAAAWSCGTTFEVHVVPPDESGPVAAYRDGALVQLS